MPSGLEVDFQEAVVFAANECLIGQDRQFRLFGVRFCDKTLIERLIAGKVVFQPCFGHFRTALHNRPVGLFDLLVTLEHLVETREGFGGTGKEHYATRRSIEPMGYTEKDRAWLVVLDLDIVLDDLRKGRIAGLVTLHDLVAGLIDRNDMAIFVEYGHFDLRFDDLRLTISLADSFIDEYTGGHTDVERFNGAGHRQTHLVGA